MEVHTDDGNFQTLRILAAASLNHENLQIKLVGSADHVVPYLSRNRLPVMVTSNGAYIFSPNSAASFIFAARGNFGDAGKTEQWLEWDNSLLLPAVHRAVLGKLDHDLGAAVTSQLQTLEAELDSKYILGEKLTVVDVAVWSTVFPLIHHSDKTKALVTAFPKVTSWFDKLSLEPAFRDAVNTLFRKDVKEALKASVTAAPVPPSVGASTRLLLGADREVAPSSKEQVEAEQAEEAVVTAAEKATAAAAWATGRNGLPAVHPISHPILPVEDRKNVLVTGALPYVNNVPHLGNIIGCVLSADVFARFCRLRGYNTLYVSGTDEYGTATETKAMVEGVTPMEICEKYNKLHTEIYDWFNISFDYFGRTTTQQQTKIAQDIFWRLHEQGNILTDTMDQLRCEQCDRFLADRFVEGTCPFCAYDDARGDQCDKCSKLVNAPDLRNPRCKICGSTPCVQTTEHLFLDLPRVSAKLESFLDKQLATGIWTHNARVITQAWLRDGLKPRCISRDLKWGTPVPLEGYTNKVFYVWYDAPIGYISMTACYTPEWEKWWRNPDQVQLYQFMAKDNIPFHSVIFPASLLGTGDTWTLVNHMSSTEYLNYEDTKFSKSRNVGIFGDQAQHTGIPADIWRFYLLFLRPESQDSAFSWDDFLLKNNSELLNNMGNFIQRALAFVANNFGHSIPEVTLTEDDLELLTRITRELTTYIDHLEKMHLRDGIRNILTISRLGNQYIQANKPWVLVKGTDAEKARAGSVLALAANMAALLSVLVQPYMPTVSATIQTQLNLPASCNIMSEAFVCILPAGHKINTPSPLFQKIDPEKIAELKKKFGSGKEASVAGAGAGAAGDVSVANPAVIVVLTEAIAKQGEAVRQLKASKADKATVTAEVTKLLSLKKELARVTGEPPAAEQGMGRKKGNQQKQQGGDKKMASTSAATSPPGGAPSPPGGAISQPGGALSPPGGAISPPGGATRPPGGTVSRGEGPEIIMALTAQVSAQGEAVRALKASKADKAVVDAGIAKLLDLKRLLAVATGQDPAEAVGGGKKSRKSKKK